MEKRIELNVPFRTKRGGYVVWKGEATDGGGCICYEVDGNRDRIGWYWPNGAYGGAEGFSDYPLHAEWFTGPERTICTPDETDVAPISAVPPPLGLKPRHLYEQERLGEIISAVARYLTAHKAIPIPQEWVDEYNELATKLGE